MHARMRVAVFFRDALWRSTLAKILADGGLEVVYKAAEPPRGDIRSVANSIDVAAFGSSFARSDLGVLKRWCAKVKVVVLADSFSLAEFRTVTRLGARGYLSSDIGTAALVTSLRLAMTGEFVFPSEFGDLLGSHGPESNGAGPAAEESCGASPEIGVLGYSGLCHRDIAILRMVAEGRSNKEIAQNLQISQDVVKMRLSTVMRLVQASNRIQAAVWAIQNGLVPPVTAGNAEKAGCR
jgi:two-component system nitrate/nitrite response regulator NarL